MNFTEFSITLNTAMEKNGISSLLTSEISEHLFFLANFLISENQKYNLTAIKEHEAIIYKHFVDSLLLSAHIPENNTVIDVGCGAGFPSLPLAIARPDLRQKNYLYKALRGRVKARKYQRNNRPR